MGAIFYFVQLTFHPFLVEFLKLVDICIFFEHLGSQRLGKSKGFIALNWGQWHRAFLQERHEVADVQSAFEALRSSLADVEVETEDPVKLQNLALLSTPGIDPDQWRNLCAEQARRLKGDTRAPRRKQQDDYTNFAGFLTQKEWQNMYNAFSTREASMEVCGFLYNRQSVSVGKWWLYLYKSGSRRVLPKHLFECRRCRGAKSRILTLEAPLPIQYERVNMQVQVQNTLNLERSKFLGAFPCEPTSRLK